MIDTNVFGQSSDLTTRCYLDKADLMFILVPVVGEKIIRPTEANLSLDSASAIGVKPDTDMLRA